MAPPTTTKKAGYIYQPVMDRTPNEQTMDERAAFLAHEIQEDALASELEIADAILTELQRFAFRRDVLFQIREDLKRTLASEDPEAFVKAVRRWAAHLDLF